jgi:cellulose synthase/poly-beta-1,6-N-acetylglucosamine synthase-like glycosyltransferase
MDALGALPLDPAMLTEDIDATVRALVQGCIVLSDPHCVSRELAPLTPTALLSQRLRWAQGWFQVALWHLGAGLRSPHLSWRRKLGLLYVLGWCQFYPWLSLQLVPLLAFWTWRDGLGHVAWPGLLLVLTALTTAGGPLQVLLAYRQARPGIGRRAGWFLAYLVLALTVYGAFKNAVTRTGQLKHLLGERDWRVTPRG